MYFDITARVAVRIAVYPADRRRRDLDNYPKAVFDALTAARVWEDDTIIDELYIVRKVPDKSNPRLVIEIKPI